MGFKRRCREERGKGKILHEKLDYVPNSRRWVRSKRRDKFKGMLYVPDGKEVVSET
jgi:hypothetical protein